MRTEKNTICINTDVRQAKTKKRIKSLLLVTSRQTTTKFFKYIKAGSIQVGYRTIRWQRNERIVKENREIAENLNEFFTLVFMVKYIGQVLVIKLFFRESV